MEFDELPIDGAAINLLDVDTMKKVDIRAFTFPDGREYFVTFFKVAGIQMCLQETPEAKIVSHSTISTSVFLKRVRKEKRKSIAVTPENLKHFQIKYGKGFIDIIAEGFTHSLIWDAQGDAILMPQT